MGRVLAAQPIAAVSGWMAVRLTLKCIRAPSCLEARLSALAESRRNFGLEHSHHGRSDEVPLSGALCCDLQKHRARRLLIVSII